MNAQSKLRLQKRALANFLQAWDTNLTQGQATSSVVKARQAARGTEWFAVLTLSAASTPLDPLQEKSDRVLEENARHWARVDSCERARTVPVKNRAKSPARGRARSVPEVPGKKRAK